MLGNVNFFSNSLTTSLIKKYDKDGDGTLSEAEQQSAQKELDGENTQPQKTEKAEIPVDYTFGVMISKYGEEETPAQTEVKTPSEARKSFNATKESFIESYIKTAQENGEMTANEKKSLIAFLNSKSSAFIDQYIKKNIAGPYNMEEITAAYQEHIQQLLTQREEKTVAVNEKVETYKANSEENFNKLADLTEKAGEDYMTDDEYSEIKGAAVDYIMGQMLKGEDITAFMTAINKNYKTNPNFKIVQSCVNAIQTEVDPDKLEGYINRAAEYIEEFFGNKAEDGTSPLTDAVEAKKWTDALIKNSETLDKTIDKMVEDFSNETETVEKYSGGFVGRMKKKRAERMGKETTREVLVHNEADVQVLMYKLTNVKVAFLNQYEGDGTNIEEEFKAYFEQVQKDYEEVQADALTYFDNAQTGEAQSKGKYEDLKSLVNGAGTYSSAEEKEAIDEKAAEYVMKTLLEGNTEDSILASMVPEYQTNGKYVLAKQLMENLAISPTPKEDYEQAQALLKEMMAEVPVSNVYNAIQTEEAKNVDLNMETFIQGLWGVGTTETDGGDNLVYAKYTMNNGKVEWTDGTDKNDINKMYSQLREKIHTQMKSQLGDMYNQADIDKYIDQAIVDTAISLDKPNELHTVDELAMYTVAYFNQIATIGLHDQVMVSNTKANYEDYDIINGLENFRGSDDRVTYKGWYVESDGKVTLPHNDNTDYRTLMDEMENRVVNKYKNSLGDACDENQIRTLFRQAVVNMMNSFEHNTGYAWGGSSRKDRHVNNFSNMIRQTMYELDKVILQNT